MWSQSCIRVRHVAWDVDCSTGCRGRIRIRRLHLVSVACDKTRSAFARRQFEGSRLDVAVQGTDHTLRTLAIHSGWVPSTSPTAYRRGGHAVVVEARSDSATSSNRTTASPSRQTEVATDAVYPDDDAGMVKVDGSWLDGGCCFEPQDLLEI